MAAQQERWQDKERAAKHAKQTRPEPRGGSMLDLPGRWWPVLSLPLGSRLCRHESGLRPGVSRPSSLAGCGRGLRIIGADPIQLRCWRSPGRTRPQRGCPELRGQAWGLGRGDPAGVRMRRSGRSASRRFTSGRTRAEVWKRNLSGSQARWQSDPQGLQSGLAIRLEAQGLGAIAPAAHVQVRIRRRRVHCARYRLRAGSRQEKKARSTSCLRPSEGGRME